MRVIQRRRNRSWDLPGRLVWLFYHQPLLIHQNIYLGKVMVSSLNIMQVELTVGCDSQQPEDKSVGWALQSPIFRVDDPGPHQAGCSEISEEANSVAYSSDLNNVPLLSAFLPSLLLHICSLRSPPKKHLLPPKYLFQVLLSGNTN